MFKNADFLYGGQTPYYSEKPDLTEQLVNFCDRYCQPIAPDEMFQRIEAGRQIGAELAHNYPQASREAAVNLIWLLTAGAAYYGDLHIQGAFRLDKGLRIFAFLKECGGNDLYPRISTHFNVSRPLVAEQGIDGGQYGIDVPENALPSQKHTILFRMLEDGCLYIKIEEHGARPFWKLQYFSIRGIVDHVLHFMDYLKHDDIDFGEGMRDCRECNMLSIWGEYKVILLEVYPSSTDPEGREVQHSTFAELASRANTFGITEMHTRLTEDPAIAAHNSPAKQSLTGHLTNIIEHFRARGYTGNIKGGEVPLPSVELLSDLKYFEQL